MIKDKRGMSLVEVISVIVIMGIIASVASVSAIAVINRQRKNAVVSSLDSIYRTAKNELLQASIDNDSEYVINVDDEFFYMSLTDLIDSGLIDGEKYRPLENEVYFCFDKEIFFVLITSSTISQTIPDSTGEAVVNDVRVTFDYANNRFKRA